MAGDRRLHAERRPAEVESDRRWPPGAASSASRSLWLRVASHGSALEPLSTTSGWPATMRPVDFTRYEPSFASVDTIRFGYLRLSVLKKALDDDKLLDMLVRDLGVPGRPAVLKGLSRVEKIKAIDVQIEHFRTTPTSEWHGVSAPEVLVGVIFQSGMSDRFVMNLFSNVKNEEALRTPVTAWLRAKDLHVFDEVPLGANRTDLLGYRKGGWFTSAAHVAVELKDDLNQLKRGLDQMASYGDYAHNVYLACTPFLAAEYLVTHASGVKVKRWDGQVLDRKLEQVGSGLLLVEGQEVFEYRIPRSRSPDSKKLEEVELALKGR